MKSNTISPKILEREYKRIMELLSSTAEFPVRHLTEANNLIVDMANAGLDTNELMERVHFLDEGYKEKDTRSPGQRLREILCHSSG